eukprot:TRINITY_DN109635_c0_g1_i1.p1 TRINITY_DN109635_c0_g1~~TRINITY_DN109635_c0_g1_i1.p1  ORF type:complete len:603 (+),score=84.98 TRINITY_DN109635_c0_g1_i1:82-1890(+)
MQNEEARERSFKFGAYAVPLSLGAILWLIGVPAICVLIFCVLWALMLYLDRGLARLACWAIARTPKHFNWEIELICVRPCLSFRPHYWSEILIINWTWYNPQGFDGGARPYILQIDRLVLKLQLASIIGAICFRKAIQVKALFVEGLRFSTQRNEEAMLNLWESLDIPDQDVNVAAIVHHARKHGGMHHHHSALVRPLPPVATTATREAAHYWRKEWGRSRTEFLKNASTPPADSNAQDFHQEIPIGDPKRRPRWGVPCRLDIQQLTVVQIEVWIFDMLTMDQRYRPLTPGDTKMSVPSLCLLRPTLEAGDPRRKGTGDPNDGVRGVYLGELVWVLIAELLPKVLESSPSNALKTAAFACGYGVRDSAAIMSAKALEVALDARYHLPRYMPCLGGSELRRVEGNCYVQVHLMCGRGLVGEGGLHCNVLARIDLQNPTPSGSMVMERDMRQMSALRLWTKSPWWDQTFDLGPVKSRHSVIRIKCFHRRTRHAASSATKFDKFDIDLGEVRVRIDRILLDDKVVSRGRAVGWFPLQKLVKKEGREIEMSTVRGHSPGFLKLGFRVQGKEFLDDLYCLDGDESPSTPLLQRMYSSTCSLPEIPDA